MNLKFKLGYINLIFYFSFVTIPLAATSGTQICLTFVYHMFGASMGTLRVSTTSQFDGGTINDELLVLSGNKGNSWLRSPELKFTIVDSQRTRVCIDCTRACIYCTMVCTDYTRVCTDYTRVLIIYTRVLIAPLYALIAPGYWLHHCMYWLHHGTDCTIVCTDCTRVLIIPDYWLCGTAKMTNSLLG